MMIVIESIEIKSDRWFYKGIKGKMMDLVRYSSWNSEEINRTR